MTKAGALGSRSKSVNSDMVEDVHDREMEALPTPDSNKEVSAPVRKARATRGRPKATATTSAKAKPASRRLSGKVAVVKQEAPTKNKSTTARAALKEQKTRKTQRRNEAVVDEGREQVESDGYETTASFDELVTKEQVSKRGRPGKKQQEPEALQEAKAVENDGEFEYTPTVVRQSNALKKSSRDPLKKPSQTAQATAGKRNPSADPPYPSKVIPIPETQTTPMDLDPSNVPEGVAHLQNSNGKGANSRQRQSLLLTKRTGGTSDTEKPPDDTRKQLEEMTRKFETLDTKYKRLKEVGIQEAQANFSSLKERAAAQNKAANEHIDSLRDKLATQEALAQQSRSLQTQLATSDDALAKAQAQVNQLTASLSQVQKENQALQAKLASLRGGTGDNATAARTPGMGGSAEAAQAAQVALLKEDLYSDLTGLILRGVERGDEADVYDCIQTGRNGTLHFKLAVASDTDIKASYEDTTFTYTPRLDSNRDRDLLELLPDYLTEEITFSRVNAAKFYGRVVDTLMKKREEGGV